MTRVVWNLTSFRLETVLVLVQDRCKACTNIPVLRNHFRHTRWYSKVMRRKSKLDLVCLEIVLI